MTYCKFSMICWINSHYFKIFAEIVLGNRNSKTQLIYRNALSHNAGLLHASRPSKLLHVLAEVTLSTLSPEARLTLSAACPPAPGSRRAAVGRQLNGRWCRPHLGLRPVGCPLLEDKWWKVGTKFSRAAWLQNLETQISQTFKK